MKIEIIIQEFNDTSETGAALFLEPASSQDVRLTVMFNGVEKSSIAIDINELQKALSKIAL